VAVVIDSRAAAAVDYAVRSSPSVRADFARSQTTTECIPGSDRPWASILGPDTGRVGSRVSVRADGTRPRQQLKTIESGV